MTMMNDVQTKMRAIMERTLSSEVIRMLDLRRRRVSISNIKDLKSCFDKVCINAYVAKESSGKQQHCRHPDLEAFATEAFENNNKFFYAEPKNPEMPYGKQVLATPKYEYRLSRNITEEEFNAIFGNNSTNE